MDTAAPLTRWVRLVVCLVGCLVAATAHAVPCWKFTAKTVAYLEDWGTIEQAWSQYVAQTTANCGSQCPVYFNVRFPAYPGATVTYDMEGYPNRTATMRAHQFDCEPNPCEAVAGSVPSPATEGGPAYSCSRTEGHLTCVSGPSTTQPTASTGLMCVPISGDKFCHASATRTMAAQKDGSWYWWGNEPKYMSTQCNDGPPKPAAPAGTPPPEPPPAGKCPGEVNGVTIYVDCNVTSTPKNNSSTFTTSTPEGGTKTENVTIKNETVCQAGACTTTTTTTTNTTINNPPAAPTTTTKTDTKTETKPKADYCKDNPLSKDCTEDNTSFSGNCQAKFSCSGGAAECAIARAVNEANCQLTPSTGIKSVADALAAGTFGAPLQVVNKSVGQFNTTNPLGSSCPTNHTLTLMGAQIVVPLADLCGELQLMGNLLVAFTLIAATMFVVRGFN